MNRSQMPRNRILFEHAKGRNYRTPRLPEPNPLQQVQTWGPNAPITMTLRHQSQRLDVPSLTPPNVEDRTTLRPQVPKPPLLTSSSQRYGT